MRKWFHLNKPMANEDRFLVATLIIVPGGVFVFLMLGWLL